MYIQIQKQVKIYTYDTGTLLGDLKNLLPAIARARDDMHLLISLAINLVAKSSNSSVMFMDGLSYVLADIHAQEASRGHQSTVEVAGQLTALRGMIATNRLPLGQQGQGQGLEVTDDAAPFPALETENPFSHAPPETSQNPYPNDASL